METSIHDIFYSGSHAFNGDIESINEIKFLVSEKYILLHKIFIADKSEYLDILNDYGKLESKYEAHGGSHAHVALKILSGKFLEHHRNKNFLYEHFFCGYYPDVLSSDSSIVIECGHTQNPEKILAYFQYQSVKECIQIPYPSVEENSIWGYSFIPQINLNEFLIFLQQEKRSKLKELLKKRNRV